MTLSLLNELSSDVILDICRSCTRWQDVLTLGKISQKFRAIFQEREIWAFLVTACVNPPDGPPVCFLDRPLYDYTTGQLQHLFKRWKKVEIGFRTIASSDSDASTIPMTLATFGMESGEIASTGLLVPGGRWFICFTTNVAARYYDLDSPTPESSPLIPPQLAQATIGTYISPSRIDMDTSASHLSFRVAFSFNPDEHDELLSELQVWSVTLVYDATCKESRLEAKQLRAFRFNFGQIGVLALAGVYLLLSASQILDSLPGETYDGEKLLFLNWSENPDGDVPPVKLLLLKNVQSLPVMLNNGTMIWSKQDGLYLYDFSNLEYYTGAPSHNFGSIDDRYPKRMLQAYTKSQLSPKCAMISAPFSKSSGAAADIMVLDQLGVGRLRLQPTAIHDAALPSANNHTPRA